MQSVHARILRGCNRYNNAELLKYAIRNVSGNLFWFLQFLYSHWSSWWKGCWHGPLWSRKRLHFWRWCRQITIFFNSSLVTPRLLAVCFSLDNPWGFWAETFWLKGNGTRHGRGFFPTRPYHSVSPSSLHGQRHLRSRWLNARPSDL